jgi:ElaB/YqjD/DUF883 family membrane-anchored ribosome-binding protein
MSDNGGRRPEQILSEISRTRDELGRTLTAIEQRLTPGQLVDQSIDYLRHRGATEFVQNLGGAAKQNPLPVALVGIGLAWLMALGRQPAQQNYGSSMSASGLQEGMSSMRDKASGAVQSASDTLASTRDRVSASVTSMRDRASQVTDTAREQWERARGGLDYLVHEQPLALGAIGLAIGAVLGAAAPRTRQEERLMGDASRGVAEKARQMGSQQLEKAEQTVRQVAETVSQESQRGPDLQPGQPEGNVPSQQAQSQYPGPTAGGPDKKGSW